MIFYRHSLRSFLDHNPPPIFGHNSCTLKALTMRILGVAGRSFNLLWLLKLHLLKNRWDYRRNIYMRMAEHFRTLAEV